MEVQIAIPETPSPRKKPGPKTEERRTKTGKVLLSMGQDDKGVGIVHLSKDSVYKACGPLSVCPGLFVLETTIGIDTKPRILSCSKQVPPFIF
jgi:hypothetical protein